MKNWRIPSTFENEGLNENWITVIEMDDPTELENLMDEDAYKVILPWKKEE